MKLHHLKPLRVTVSLVFFLLIALLFLDFQNTGIRSIAGELLYLQFVPSLLKFINGAVLGATGFIMVLLITLLLGRVYCATVCPFGTFQDLMGRLTRKKKQKRHRYSYSRPHNILRYTLFSLTVLLFLTGSGLLLNLIDPFSSFGRILSNLIRPLTIGMNNLMVPLVESLGGHALYRVQWQVVAPVSVGVSLAWLFLVGWMGARHGRLYCNTICPVGALLGCFSKFSWFKICIAPEACKGCKQCEGVCKAGCINLQEMTIDVSRCVSCYNCLVACPEQALSFENGWQRRTRRDLQGSGRREFMLGLVLGSVGMINDAAGQPNELIQSRPTTIPEKRTCPISPPGSVSVAQFTATCTACHLCVSVCPSRVLVPSFLKYGLSGFMQPQMDFQAGHCNYECTACMDVCPSGAILTLQDGRKQTTQIGVAQFIKGNCVVYTDKTNCGACSEHCPTKAVHMVPYLNAAGRKLVIPEVNPDICIGCGGCEHACPTRPYRAIYVDGNPVHKIAQKPVTKKIKEDAAEDFPF